MGSVVSRLHSPVEGEGGLTIGRHSGSGNRVIGQSVDRLTESDLDRWTKTFDTEFPAALDPEYELGAVIKADAFPANILIDTRTMTIVDVVSGVPPESYWATFEDLARAE